jgi:hypothetical protein
MAKAAPKKEVPAKPKQGKAVDRFENDWDGVPNFKLSPAKKKPAKKK